MLSAEIVCWLNTTELLTTSRVCSASCSCSSSYCQHSFLFGFRWLGWRSSAKVNKFCSCRLVAKQSVWHQSIETQWHSNTLNLSFPCGIFFNDFPFHLTIIGVVVEVKFLVCCSPGGRLCVLCMLFLSSIPWFTYSFYFLWHLSSTFFFFPFSLFFFLSHHIPGETLFILFVMW